MNAKDIAKHTVIIMLWLIAIGAVIALLAGCEALRGFDQRTGRFLVKADCERNKVDVEFNLDQQKDDKSIKVTR